MKYINILYCSLCVMFCVVFSMFYHIYPYYITLIDIVNLLFCYFCFKIVANGRKMHIDVDGQSKEDILSHIRQVLGKTE